MRVFLSDDHPLFRIGMRLSFEQEDHIDLVGEASDGYSSVERILSSNPDVSLIDVDMPGMSGIGVVRILRKAGFQKKIIILSTYNDETYIRDAMDAGADGYVLKCVEGSELIRILRSMHEDRPTVSPYLVNLALNPSVNHVYLNSNLEETAALTSREKEILDCLSEGQSNKEISTTLNISVETVKSHLRSIYKKLNAKSRVEAAKLAISMKRYR
ncbi:MAG: response regulator transcription factor [Deltaproteobacteria bacterium]|nr:response regulator transcription factor [Deltaproteobacteria bacterium]